MRRRQEIVNTADIIMREACKEVGSAFVNIITSTDIALCLYHFTVDFFIKQGTVCGCDHHLPNPNLSLSKPPSYQNQDHRH